MTSMPPRMINMQHPNYSNVQNMPAPTDMTASTDPTAMPRDPYLGMGTMGSWNGQAKMKGKHHHKWSMRKMHKSDSDSDNGLDQSANSN